MAGIVYKTIVGPVVPVEVTRSLTESNYTAVTPGTKTLYLKTGVGANDKIRYGLTTDVSASQYSPHLSLSNTSYYIARQTTYYTESYSEHTYESVETEEQVTTTQTTRESWYYNNAVIQTTSSTQVDNVVRLTAYVYEMTSSNIGGRLYRTLTMLRTSYYSNNKYYYFSTTDKTTTHSATANGLTYKFSTTIVNDSYTNYNLNPPEEKYWYLNPTNNLAYSYAAGYTVSGQKVEAYRTNITAYISADMIAHSGAYQNTLPGVPSSIHHGGGYTHKSQTTQTTSSRRYSGTVSTFAYKNGTANPSYSNQDIFTKLSNRVGSTQYGSRVFSTTTTASKTYNSYTNYSSVKNVTGYSSKTYPQTSWLPTFGLWITSATITISRVSYTQKTNGSKWAKGDKYLPLNSSYASFTSTQTYSRYSISYLSLTTNTRSASAYVTTNRTYTSRESQYNVNTTVTVSETVTVTEMEPVTTTSMSNNVNV